MDIDTRSVHSALVEVPSEKHHAYLKGISPDKEILIGEEVKLLLHFSF